MAAGITHSQIDDLTTRVSGRVSGPGASGWDETRAVWNAMIDRQPAVVVRAGSIDDVATAVRFAQDAGVELAVRGGGHNVAGNGTVDGGVVLDLADLTTVTVDEADATVRVEAGATLAHVDAATESTGLAVPLGVVSATGVAGLTLGGGVGWLARAHGLAADNLLEVELVTADGTRVRASEAEHADLFWALKGGGGNFGVVTAFTFRAHPLGPRPFVGNLVYRQDSWRRAWAGFEEWTRDLPWQMTSITTTLTPPPVAEMGDEPLLLVGFAWASPDHAGGDALVQQLRDLAPPDEEEVGAMPWAEWQSAVDAFFPKGVRAYWRNTSFDRLDHDVVDVLVRRGAEQTWVGTAFDVHHLGGAFGAVPEDATPFPNRSARFWLNVYGFWQDPADDVERVAFVRGLSADFEPFATGGHYTNFQGRESDGHRGLSAQEVFGEAKYRRLVEVKRRYDPDNVFHLNTNIPPG